MGYIGLPTAAVMANAGLKVHGVDIAHDVVETLALGKIHIVEPGLETLVKTAIEVNNLTVSSEVRSADAYIIAVPTPLVNRNRPDLSHVYEAAGAIAPSLEKNNLVVLESTSPVGTTEEVSRHLSKLRPDLNFPHDHPQGSDIAIAYCPERVLPGQILRELVENDRIIGGVSSSCTASALNLYNTFVTGNCLETSAKTAEMVKLTENSFRDVNIAFANELSMICDQVGVDVWELVELANRHPRVDVLQPGPGVGGHCIAVDPWFLIDTVPDISQLIHSARLVNDAKPDHVIAKVMASIKSGEQICVACLGLTFKANIDDLRGSPALAISERLAISPDISIKVVEPHIDQLPVNLARSNVELLDVTAAIAAADVILLLVDHDQFAEIPANEDLSDKIIIDTRGQWR